eukprot:2235130-Pyramimonas_sp.AAC.1
MGDYTFPDEGTKSKLGQCRHKNCETTGSDVVTQTVAQVRCIADAPHPFSPLSLFVSLEMVT